MCSRKQTQMEDTNMDHTEQEAAAADENTKNQEEEAINTLAETPAKTTATIVIPSKEGVKEFFSNTFVLAILVAISVFIIGTTFRNYANESGEALTAPLVELTRNQTDIDSLSTALLPIEKKKIESLNQIINMHKAHHKATFLMMYEFHYANITFLAIFSILTASMVFLVGQKGWNNSVPLTKRLFIVFAAYTAFYGVSINIYQQKENIQNNLDAYVNYDNLQKEIYSFSLSDPYTVEKDTIGFNQFFTSTSLKLRELNQVYMQFDETAASRAKIEIPGDNN